MSVSTNPSARGREAAAAPARRVRRLSGRDKVVLGLMVGIPTLIQLVLVWIPHAHVGRTVLHQLERAGADRHQARRRSRTTSSSPRITRRSGRPSQHNVLWLAFLALVATPLGLLLAVLLDQNIRGSRIYQSIFFAPVMLSLALVGDHLAAVVHTGTAAS